MTNRKMVVGIDPGLSATGIGMHCPDDWDGIDWHTRTIRGKSRTLPDRVLWIADCVKREIQHYWTGSVDLLVIELPQIYQHDKGKGDPNDLIKLAVLVGSIMRAIPAEKVLLPRAGGWKGQTPKEIHHKRIRARLPDLGRCSKDALDAVGLALYGLDHAPTI